MKPSPSSGSGLVSLIFTPDMRTDPDLLRTAFQKARAHYRTGVDVRLECNGTMGVLVGHPYLVHKAFQMILEQLEILEVKRD